MALTIGPTPYLGDNSGVGPSGAIWHDLPDNILDPNVGCYDFWDLSKVGDYPSTSGGAFTSATSGAWGGFSTYGYQGATVVDAAIAGGGLTFASDGDNEGVYIARLAAAFKIASTTKKLWFEARWNTAASAETKHNTFVGLMESFSATTALPILTTDVMGDKNLIGFFNTAAASSGTPTNEKVVRAVYTNSGQTGQMFTTSGVAAYSATNVTTSVMKSLSAASTYVKTGFVYDPNATSDKAITIYIDGVPIAYATTTNRDAATFPNDTFLTPIFGVMNATGSTPQASTLAWLRVAQIY